MKTFTLALVRQRYAQDGGAERFVARAVEALAARGVRLLLVTRAWDATGAARVETCDPFYLGRVWRDWAFARCACRRLARLGADLVQSHERLACCDIYRAGDGVHREWLLQRRRVLGVAARAALALNPYHRYVLAAERAMFHSPRLRAVICNSRMVQEEIQRHFGLPAERLHVVYNGIDTAAYHPDVKRRRAALRASRGIPADAPLFLFVGSGFERKGLAVLLAALAHLPRSAHLLVVGRDKHLARFRARAAALGLAQRVSFTGAVDDVKPYYGAADALVLPTLYDPFPNVVLEAMACGLPVVTSRKSGAAELIEHGRNGYVCDALDLDALAACMTQLLEPATCARVGAAARARAEPYTLTAMGRTLLDLYRNFLPAGN